MNKPLTKREQPVNTYEFYILRSDVKRIVNSYDFPALKEVDVSGKYGKYVTDRFKKDLVERVMSYKTNEDYESEI